MKVIDKTKLDPVARGHLFQEVRCMKMVQHPNVVRLYEVIDTATKLYLILELGDGGDMYDCIMKHDGGLSEEVRGGERMDGVGLSGHQELVNLLAIVCLSCHRLTLDLPREN